jgi:hypothetical protein
VTSVITETTRIKGVYGVKLFLHFSKKTLERRSGGNIFAGIRAEQKIVEIESVTSRGTENPVRRALTFFVSAVAYKSTKIAKTVVK